MSLTYFQQRTILNLLGRPKTAATYARQMWDSPFMPPSPYDNIACKGACHLRRLEKRGLVFKGRDKKWYASELGANLVQQSILENL